MKKQILLLSFLFSLFVSCVKEDDTVKDEAPKEEEPVVIKNSHRITRSNRYNYVDTLVGQSTYTYDGERLVTFTNFTGYGVLKEESRSDFSYSENEITCIDTYKSTTWNTKQISKYDKGVLTEFANFRLVSGEYTVLDKTTYQYTDGKLTSYVTFNPNTMLEYRRGNIIYDNGKVIKISISNNKSNVWINQTKIDCFYENGKLVKKNQSEFDSELWKLYYTTEYFYTGNEITSGTITEMFEGKYSTYKFENNYLVEVSNMFGKTIYEYEEGHGNTSILYGGINALLFDVPTIK